MVNEHMKVKDWLITFLLASIPVVNIVFLLLWAFGSNVNEVKQTWAKASIIWIIVIMALTLVFWSIATAVFLGSMPPNAY